MVSLFQVDNFLDAIHMQYGKSFHDSARVLRAKSSPPPASSFYRSEERDMAS